jgi:hypothetical protein
VAVVVVIAVLVVIVAVLLAAILTVEVHLAGPHQEVSVALLGLGVRVDTRRREWRLRLGSWCLLRRPLRGSGRDDAAEAQREKRRAKRAGRPPETGERSWFGVARAWRERRAIRSSVTALLRAVRLDHLEAEATVGTDDPALTGMLCGLSASMCYPVGAVWPNVRLQLTPDFAGPALEGTLSTRMRVRVYHLALFGLRAARLARRLTPSRRRKREEPGDASERTAEDAD